LEAAVQHARAVHVVELSNGQMVRDVQLVVAGRRPVTFYSRMGGALPSVEELLEHLKRQLAVQESAQSLSPFPREGPTDGVPDGEKPSPNGSVEVTAHGTA